mgnify:CR=1 FL=1
MIDNTYMENKCNDTLNNNTYMENKCNDTLNNNTSLENIIKIRQHKERSYSESQVNSKHNEIPISNYADFKNKYNIKKTPIGKGTFATVHYATDEKGNEYAMKRISVDKLEESKIDKFLLELHISQRLVHKNIVTCYEVFRTRTYWYIVSEYCCCGTLRSLIKKMKNITNLEQKESTARYYLYQLRDAILYLHENNIIHRDLKPDNILLTLDKNSSKIIVKLSDFGFSRYFNSSENALLTGYDDMISTICGSPIYMAPELLVKLTYNIKADIWSFGVIMYEMLHGNNPYCYARNISELKNIMLTKIISSANFSPTCIDLLRKILQPDPIKRITWKDFFEHDWLNSPIEYEDFTSNVDNKEEIEEQQIFELDEDLEKKIIKKNITQSVPTLKLPQKKSEDDFIMIQRDEDELIINSNENGQIKVYNETYTSSIIKILASSIVYVFGGSRQQSHSI